MKGVIVNCLEAMVRERHGIDAWERVLERAGLPRDELFLATRDVDDATVIGLFDATREIAGASAEEAADAFGDYWVNEFAPRVYPMYFDHISSAREMLLAMDRVHVQTTEIVRGSRPPRFEYRWIDDRTLEIRYRSGRGLIHLAAGLARGVGRRFDERLDVTVIGDDEMRVVFG